VQRIIRRPRRSDDVAVTHELLRRGAIEERAYQVNIARASLERSTLVVLPTGMGKTVIAAMVVAEVLRRKGGKVLFLAPTKPLVEQHAASMRKVLVLDQAKGGVATAWMLHEMKSRGLVPLALVFNRVNPILAQGAAFGSVTIVDRFESDVTDLIQTGDELRIDPAAGVVEILNR